MIYSKEVKNIEIRTIDADDLTIRVGRLLELKPERGDLERLMDADNLWKEDKSAVHTLQEKLDRINLKLQIRPRQS